MDTIEKFAAEAAEKIKEYLPEEYRDTECKPISMLKNNGINMTGIGIRKAGGRVSMNLYIEPYFDAYKHGEPFEKILEDMASVVAEQPELKEQDISALGHFDSVRDSLMPAVVNTKANLQMLEGVPHFRLEDLSVLCRASIPFAKGGGSMNVTENLLKRWGIKREELFGQAFENAQKPGMWEIVSLEECIEQMTGKGKAPVNLFEVPEDYFLRQGEKHYQMETPAMFLLYSKNKLHGAAALACPGIIEKAGRLFPEGIYIVPSSVHELAVVRRGGFLKYPELKKMLQETNRTVLERTEVLSDNIYEYDRERGKIRIAADPLEKEKGRGMER